VLLDIVMPGLDGYEVCRRLRAQESTRELPIMFLSALEDVRDKTRGFEVGGNDYLTKPFEVLEVKARVRSLLKAKAYADAIREAMARDLLIAREIQMGILPTDLAAATSHSDLDVHAIIEPAQKVGGDLYEVLRASDDRLVVALGDVSGKGIPAALFMAVTVTVLRTLARHIVDPAEILSRLNDELVERNPRGMFVTVQCLVFDLENRRVSCAGAGHHQLAIVSPGRPPRLACPSSGRPAGLMASNPIECEILPLEPGDTFVLYSDGVSEAMNAADDFYGDERLLAVLSAGANASAADTVARVLADVRAFAAGAKQSDDITVLAARYAPAS
jgi:serine phosphatase RsbU (regulator of sigma subunit)